MTRARLDGVYMLLLGSLMFLMLGFVLESISSTPSSDFSALYYPAKCLIQHHDPYMSSEVLRVYQAEIGSLPADTANVRQIATQNPYPPTAFLLSVPFALLPWGPAHIVWLLITAAGLILASILIWSLGENYSPVLSGVLIGFLLANSEVLLITGNAAGVVISLCVVAVWCFFRERFVPVGILCFAISLAVKPHDTGLVWLYFLLAGGVYRKRALQTLAVTFVVGMPEVLWVWRVAPHWIQEMHFNILAYSVHGGMNDPGPASSGGHGLDMLISLQTVASVFRDNPRFYNPASYLVCGVLLLVWALVTLRSRPSLRNFWLALAAIAALSMLPIYHRQVDAKLLLLTVPACAMLWAEGGPMGRLALLVNAAGFVATADIPQVNLMILISHTHLPATGVIGKILMVAQVFPGPLTLLAMGIFYLWIYACAARKAVCPSNCFPSANRPPA